MSATVIVPFFAIGSYITLFGTIIGLSKRYKDPHYEPKKVVDFKLELESKPVVSQTKKTQPTITSIPVSELKPKLAQTKITEVTLPESKPKVVEKTITSVPVEESKIQVPQKNITVVNSKIKVVEKDKVVEIKTPPIKTQVLQTQTNNKVPEVKTLQLQKSQASLKVKQVNSKELTLIKMPQNTKEKNSSLNESLPEVVAVAATAAAQKTMQLQSQVTTTLLSQSQQTKEQSPIKAPALAPTPVQSPIPEQTPEPEQTPAQTPAPEQTPVQSPIPEQTPEPEQTPAQTPLQAQTSKQFQQKVQLDTVNKELQKTISNIPTVNAKEEEDNTAPSKEVVKQVIKFFIKINSQYRNPTTNTKIGGSPSDNLKILILKYIEFLQYLINTPNILRLSSLNTHELENAITGTESIELTITNNSNTSTIDSTILLEFFNKFFYIDLTDLIYRLNNTNEQKLKVLAPIVEKYNKNNEKKMSVYVFIQILKDIANSTENAIKKYVYNIFSTYIVDMYDKKILDTYIEITEALNSKGNNNVTKILDKIFKEKAKNTILTFVKIRSDLSDVYNKRFDIKTDTDKTKLYIKYNDHDFKYYDKDAISNEIRTKTDIFLNTTTISTLAPKKYDHQFLFGPFTNIFPPEYSNNKIGEQLPQIMESLKANKPVIILGYGASGAGKTSTLVYYNKTKENGILIELCDKLASETDYKNIDLTSYEFYREPSKDKITIKKSPKEKSNAITFNYSKPGEQTINLENNSKPKDTKETFRLSQAYTHTNTFTDRTKTDTKIFPIGTNMGEVIIHLIDTDRYVKATTNNPNSSRSHSLIIIKFKKSNQQHTKNDPVLIIGDFAGVENKFNCEDKDILSAFSDVRINDKQTFYSVYPIGIPEKKDNGQKAGVPLKPAAPKPAAPKTAAPKTAAPKPAAPKTAAAAKTATAKPPVNSTSPYLAKTNISMEIKKEDTCKEYKESIYIPSESSLRANLDNQKYTKFNLLKKNTADDSYSKTEAYNKIELMFMKLLNPLSDNSNSNNFIKFITGNIDLPALLEENQLILERDLDILREYNKIITKANINKINIQNLKSESLAYTPKDFIIYLLSRFIDKDGVKIYKNVFQLDDKPCLNINLEKTDQKSTYPYFTCGNTIKQNFAIFSLYENTKTYLKEYIDTVSTIPENLSKNLKFQLKKLKIDATSLTIKAIVECHNKYNEKNKAIIKAHAPGTNTKCNQKEYQNLVSENLVSENLNITLNDILKNIYTYFTETFILKDIIDVKLDNIQNDNYSNVMTNLLEKLAALKDLGDYADVISEMYTNFKELVLELSCRMKQAKEICEVRTNEGIMINDTLGECRNLIGKLIDEKNKDVINLIPSFENACLPTYCKDDVCFPKKQYKKTEGKGTIFSVIEKELTYTDTDTDKTKTNRYKDLIICIFCVFNISLTANNPPPVPYININELKLQFKDHKGITEICKSIITKITVDLKSKTGELMKKKEYIEFATLFTKIQNPLPKGSDIIINNFINLIDKFNAASAIGTLEFTDSLAKYYTTDIVCKPPDNLSGYTDILSKK